MGAGKAASSRNRRLAGMAALALAGCASAAPPADQASDQALRLLTISTRLAVANAGECAAPRPFTGLLLHELGQYAARDRARVAAATGLGDGIGVLGTVADGAAARAGLRAGDEIAAVNGEMLRDRLPPSTARTGGFARMDAFEQLLDAALGQAPATLLVRRGDATIPFRLAADRGCGGDAVLAPGDALDAWSDGDHLAVTTRLAAFATRDDELAFVVAHEMAHNLLGHAAHHQGAKPAEIAADRRAIPLMARAGFAPAGATSLLARAAAVRGADLPLTHPGIARRLRIVGAAMATARDAAVRATL